ncbi:cyclase family protein [Chengkuizengella axinellae]|uniref:Cyclase family protein n=1 Tax=Chengkuizengella axinellae TaxID=3064388 RepID=A0ABT9IT68_9BACL|nr:cyclase family protein [Chengkuizengella sp. 2205SS18-9]MDP5272518.1 cyclase family protein [Chengkuizengella sp. 2205SS18-9]
MFKIYDISMTIHEGMQVYKNKEEKKPKIETASDFSNSSAFESILSLNVHTGTHLDAPLHMIEGGETIETIPLENLVSTARVLDLTHVEGQIGRSDLEPFAIQEGEWLLFKTKNSFSEQFDFNFVYLNEDGAAFLRDKNVKGIGTDGLGIERAQPDHETHKILFENKIVIVEGLRLKDVPSGTYFMVVAPLKLEGIDAAPARAFLLGQ